MATCEDEVALAMQGAVLTPEELAEVRELCGGNPAFLVVHQLKFDRARVELRHLYAVSGRANDGELWELAYAFLGLSMDPKAALEQAMAELDKSRDAKIDLDKQRVLEQMHKKRRELNQHLNAGGSGLGGGPK